MRRQGDVVIVENVGGTPLTIAACWLESPIPANGTGAVLLERFPGAKVFEHDRNVAGGRQRTW